MARGRIPLSRLDPSRFELESCWHQASPGLSRTVQAVFSTPTPLATVLEYLAEQSGVQILVNGPALASANLALDTPCRLIAAQIPLAEALQQVLPPLGLQIRAIDNEVLQVTTAEAITEHLEMEFYRVAALLTAGMDGEQLVAQIQERIAVNTWTHAAGPARVHFDPQGRCLIVLQSQDVQREIEQYLDDLGGTSEVARLR